jgi:5-methylthioadenosine/S-adenosylhomocysteine deaminase
MPQDISTADTLIHAGWIVPVVPREQVLTGHSLAIHEGRISAIVPTPDAAAIRADTVLELPEHALIPGLVNCHGHAAMSLLRGYADDLPLMPWLQNHIWPAESEHVGERFVHDGTELAMAEMLRAGTTCFSDMYFFPNIVADLCQQVGLRSQLTFPILDFATAWARNGDEYIARGLDLRDAYKHSELVNVVFGPHAVYTVSEANLVHVSTLAAELDVAVQIHLQEGQAEIDDALASCGERPLQRLQRLGLLGPKTQCVHMTAVSDDDIELLVRARAHVIHCPQSNMKLASGTCPVPTLLEAGVNVALGTDSAASNNDLNLFGEMQSAALLAKLAGNDASALPASTALELATLGGARALGLDQQIGSLEPGKAADIVAVDLAGPETQPLYHLHSQLAYASNGSQVSHVWVNGRALLQDRQLTSIDLNGLSARIRDWQRRIIPHT